MASQAEEFILKLNQQISGPASAATGALAQLEAQIRKEQDALGGLEAKLGDSQKRLATLQEGFGGKVDISAVRKQQEQIAALQDQISKKKIDVGKLEGSRDLAQHADAMKANKEAFEATSGPAGALVGKIQSLADAFGRGGAAGGMAGAALAAAQALLALVTVVAGAVTAFALFGLAAGDAARSVQLLNNAAAGGVVAGAELSAVVADIAGKVPLASTKLAEMARSLEIARLAGRNMQVTLSAMGTLAAAVGDGAAGKIQQIAESSMQARRFMLGARDIYGEFASLAGTGVKAADVYAALAGSMKVSIDQAKALLLSGRVSVAQGLEALDAAVQAKFGKTVAAQMLALTTQLSKLKENFSKLFEGLDLEPFLRGLKTVTELFSQSTVTGRALRLLVTTLLQPLLDAAAASFPIIRAFFQGIAIGALLVVVAALQIRKAWRDAFGGDTKSNIDLVKVALYAGIGVVGAFVAVVGALAAAFAVLAIVGTIVFFPIIAAVVLTVAAVYKIIQAVNAVKAGLAGIDLGAEARNFVQSFVNAITIENVVAAMTSLGNAAKDALKRALGIASPSKVAVEAAQNVTRSFSDTVEDGTGATRAAFNGMVDPAAVGVVTAQRGGNIYNIGPINVGSREDGDEFEERLHRVLSKLMGEGPTPSTT